MAKYLAQFGSGRSLTVHIGPQHEPVGVHFPTLKRKIEAVQVAVTGYHDVLQHLRPLEPGPAPP